ncbi:MAG: 3-hydroxyacyl-CoA dehydrogenase [Planctomycetota bacterium]|jgi:3-hydroxybutyryl-CoA dehydrogenase
MAELKSFGVVGSGIMGRGIAEVAACRGGFEKVVLQDVVQEQLDGAVKTIEKDLSKLVEKGKMDEAAKGKALGVISATTDSDALAECGFVVEAVPEDLNIKERVLGAVSGAVGKGAVVASNTSSIPITRLAGFVRGPERFIGMHFMNPVPRMKGLEIIKGLYTSRDVCDLTLALGEKFGKKVTFSKDRAGFVINRVLIPMLNDAALGLDAGLGSVEAVDKFCKAEAGHPMGPFMLSDLIGLDTIEHILGVLAAELCESFAPAALLSKMVKAGACGQKTGKGFYVWERGKPPALNAEVAGLAGKKAADEGEKLGRRAWLVMINEAVKVIEEGTSAVADVDRGCQFCLGHPKGILAALDELGADAALGGLEAAEKEFGAAYKPAPLLRRMVEAGFTGKSAGQGVYTWKGDEAAGVNPVLEAYLD